MTGSCVAAFKTSSCRSSATRPSLVKDRAHFITTITLTLIRFNLEGSRPRSVTRPRVNVEAVPGQLFDVAWYAARKPRREFHHLGHGRDCVEFPKCDLFGHPRGLSVLFATETWERFSYFGNSALVVLYMVQYLLQPGRIEGVI